MKFLISFLILTISASTFAGQEGGGGPKVQKLEHAHSLEIPVSTGQRINDIIIEDVLLNTLLTTAKTTSSLAIGNISYREVNPTLSDNNRLENGLGFLIDLSNVQSVDTDKGIINLDDFSFKEGSKLLINENSGINDVFTKNGDLIIFNK